MSFISHPCQWQLPLFHHWAQWPPEIVQLAQISIRELLIYPGWTAALDSPLRLIKSFFQEIGSRVFSLAPFVFSLGLGSLILEQTSPSALIESLVLCRILFVACFCCSETNTSSGRFCRFLLVCWWFSGRVECPFWKGKKLCKKCLDEVDDVKQKGSPSWLDSASSVLIGINADAEVQEKELSDLKPRQYRANSFT